MLYPPFRTCGHTPTVFPHVLRQRAHSDDFPSQGNPLLSSHGTNSLGKTASGLRGFSPLATRRFPSHGAPILGTSDVTPLRPLAENFLDWLSLPNPSRWLLRTIRLGYAIQFARRPPKFRGVLTTSVQGSNSNFCTCVRAQDWFVAIDLKDTYFHVSILPRHRPFLRFAFKGRAYQYKVLPFGLSLSPHVFTKVAEAALAPSGKDMVLNHLAQLGLRVNWEKSKLSLVQRISFLGVELDSVQRLLGHMASSAAVTPLGLMHMRPLQHWLHTRVPRWAWHRGTFRVSITPWCRKILSPWTDIVFLWSGVPLEQVSRCIVVTTDASKTGWGAVCNGQSASGVWKGPRLHWHINCLELLAVLLALRRFRPLIQGKHVLVQSDNTATVAYINHQGGVRSFRMSQLARHLLLWSQHRLRSLCATHIPGEANCMADSLSRQVSLGGEWRLHPQSVQLIWDRFGQAQVDLFASPESTHCQLWYGLTEAPLGIDALTHTWPRDRLKYAFPPNLVLRPGAPGISSSLAHSSEEGPPLSGEGHNLAPAPRSLEPPPMVPGRDQEDFRDLSPSVNPRRCGIESVLSFLQEGLDRHLSASTLKVHVAAISANHDLVGGRSGLQQDPFEPLQSVELDALSLKTALLTALTSVKRVRDLQALSVNSSCLEFRPADSHVVLRPRPGYVPKVPTTPFRHQMSLSPHHYTLTVAPHPGLHLPVSIALIVSVPVTNQQLYKSPGLSPCKPRSISPRLALLVSTAHRLPT
ncbi:ORF V: Enzymatic polyprotein [Labeo rohita]|uniref:ribonuclease H n=1 Tax=Labeo rohita TaxID=84645 RepID=A0ABQ8LB29_LABRO|nr:ORF V: Enzymatic polyprotein [Labeo rohita]